MVNNMKRKILKFQQGGVPQVFNLGNSPIQGIVPNMQGIQQAAMMPIDGGLSGYLQTQQLDLQQDAFQQQKIEFQQRIKQQDKENLYRDLQHLNTIRDDFMNLEILPEDQAGYESLRGQYVTQDMLDAAAKGDQNAMINVMRASTALAMDPRLSGYLSRKKANDANIKNFSVVAKEYDGYILNMDEIQTAIASGKQVPPVQIDHEGYNAAKQLAKETAANLQKANAHKAEAEAMESEQKANVIKQTQASLRASAKERLNLTDVPDDQITPEQQLQIDAIMIEDEVELKRTEIAYKKMQVEDLKIKSEIGQEKVNMYHEFRKQGMNAATAAASAGINDVSAEDLIKMEIMQQPDMSLQQKVEAIRRLNDKDSTVTYNNGAGGVGYTQQTKSSDRNYGNYITDSHGVELKNFKIGNRWWEKKDLPKSVQIELRGNGEAYFILDGKTSENTKFLRDFYGFDIESGLPDHDYNDAIESGPLHGTGAYNLDGSGDRIAIPIHDASRQTSNTNKGSRVTNNNTHKSINPKRKEGL